VDNCPLVANPTQDPGACADQDGDGVFDVSDNCPTVANGAAQAAIPGVGNQTNTDGDSMGDACDPDDDNDGALDGADNCQFVSNPTQGDWNSDGVGDQCQDFDGDGHMDNFEVYVGTGPDLPCAVTGYLDIGGGNDDEAPDARPFDFNDDQAVNLSDVLRYNGAISGSPIFGATGPLSVAVRRYDLSMDDSVSLSDVLKFNIPGVFGSTCIP